MEITNVHCVRLEGTLSVDDPSSFWEERLVRPIDLYDEFRSEGPAVTTRSQPADDGTIEQYFLIVETDEGIEGLSGPITRQWAEHAVGLADLLVGRDPRATQKAWDLLYRHAVHGRKGIEMHAISALDCALWDVTGKYYGEPVYRLLGGPTREELPAYASMLGFSIEPDAVRERAEEFADRGFDAQKWFFRHGPGSGGEGIERNVALAAAAREGIGDDRDLMLDAWMSWNREYALEMIDRLAPYDPRWLEEPVMPDRIDQYATLREAAPFPIAGGEHEYTRWGCKELLERGAVDVLQPDTFWGGGITEMTRICTLASVYDVPVIPHGHSVPANVHLVAAHSSERCPLVEYLVKWNELLQHFFEEPVTPENGTIRIPDRPGLGIAIDDETVESREEVTFE